MHPNLRCFMVDGRLRLSRECSKCLTNSWPMGKQLALLPAKKDPVPPIFPPLDEVAPHPPPGGAWARLRTHTDRGEGDFRRKNLSKGENRAWDVVVGGDEDH